MKIKKIEEFNGDTMNIKTRQYEDYLLVIGKISDIFDYFGIEELYGLKRI